MVSVFIMKNEPVYEVINIDNLPKDFKVKSVHFGHVQSQLFSPVNTRVHGKLLSSSYDAIIIFEQIILFFKDSFSR